MVSANPFAEFRAGCETALKAVFNKQYPQISIPFILLETPPNPKYGELASSICFELAKQTKNKPRKIAEQIIQTIDVSGFPFIQSVKAAGEGYINFYANFEEFSRLTIESVKALDNEYGYVKTSNPKKIIVEHTSMGFLACPM